MFKEGSKTQRVQHRIPCWPFRAHVGRHSRKTKAFFKQNQVFSSRPVLNGALAALQTEPDILKPVRQSKHFQTLSRLLLPSQGVLCKREAVWTIWKKVV